MRVTGIDFDAVSDLQNGAYSVNGLTFQNLLRERAAS
jgi:hypothetical protein